MIDKFSLYDERPFQSVMTDFSSKLTKGLLDEQDDIIKAHLVKKGLPITEEFLKEHCALIIIEDDPFEHMWYHHGKPDAVRIISIEREMNVSYVEELGGWKMRAEKKYY